MLHILAEISQKQDDFCPLDPIKQHVISACPITDGVYAGHLIKSGLPSSGLGLRLLQLAMYAGSPSFSLCWGTDTPARLPLCGMLPPPKPQARLLCPSPPALLSPELSPHMQPPLQTPRGVLLAPTGLRLLPRRAAPHPARLRGSPGPVRHPAPTTDTCFARQGLNCPRKQTEGLQGILYMYFGLRGIYLTNKQFLSF